MTDAHGKAISDTTVKTHRAIGDVARDTLSLLPIFKYEILLEKSDSWTEELPPGAID